MSFDIGIQIQKYGRTDQLMGLDPFPLMIGSQTTIHI